jgi:hypothetical protein
MERFTNKEIERSLNSYKGKTVQDVQIADSNIPYLREVVDEDVETMRILFNTWSYYFLDLTGSDFLSTYARRKGLIETIAEATMLKDTFITGNADLALLRPGTPWFFLREKPIRDILGILGFPKRVKVVGANLSKIGIEKFLLNNKRLSEPIKKDTLSHYFGTPKWVLLPDHTTYRFLVEARHQIKVLLGCDNTTPEDFNWDRLILPPGMTFEKDVTYVDKYITLSHFRKMFPFEDLLLKNDERELTRLNRLNTVPKNWKAVRTICPEEIARQVAGYNIAIYIANNLASVDTAILEIRAKDIRDKVIQRNQLLSKPFKVYKPKDKNKVAPCFIEYKTYLKAVYDPADIRNQENNQFLAFLGSCGLPLATIDFSAASDSISVDLCKIILPEWLFEAVDSVRATHTLVNGRKVKLNTMVTMGHSCTFPLETLIFLACARAACMLCPFCTPDPGSCAAYGDDVIIPDCAADFFMVMMDRIGFIPNREKTFFEGPYRESCGSEFYDGFDVSHVYWPRGTSGTRLAELISLQHKLFVHPQVNAYLCEEIFNIRPRICTAEPGVEGMDIWIFGGNILRPSQTPYAQYDPHVRATTADGKTLILPIVPGVKPRKPVSMNLFDSVFQGPTGLFALKWGWDFGANRSVWHLIRNFITDKVSLRDEDAEPIIDFEVKSYRRYSVRNELDLEPYRLATIITNQVPKCADTDRLSKAEQLAYALTLTRKTADLTWNAETLGGPYVRKTNRILPEKLLDSLCSESHPVLQEKIIREN